MADRHKEAALMAGVVDEQVQRAIKASADSQHGPPEGRFSAEDFLLDIRQQLTATPDYKAREVAILDHALDYFQLGHTMERGHGIGLA